MIYAAEWLASLIFLLYVGANLLEVFAAVIGSRSPKRERQIGDSVISTSTAKVLAIALLAVAAVPLLLTALIMWIKGTL